MRLGMLVRVINPDYAKGLRGIIEDREPECDRWIIKLEPNPWDEEDKPARLSLTTSDFEVIEPDRQS